MQTNDGVPDQDVNKPHMYQNEVLCYITYKLQWLPPDTVHQLCLRGYNEEQIDEAKDLLFSLCGDPDDKSERKRRHRQGPDKMQRMSNTLNDIIDLVTRKSKSENYPMFMAKDLSLLPEVSFNSIDVSSLLAKMENMTVEIDLLKRALELQTTVCNDLKTMFERKCQSTRTQNNTTRVCTTPELCDTPILGNVDSDETLMKSVMPPRALAENTLNATIDVDLYCADDGAPVSQGATITQPTANGSRPWNVVVSKNTQKQAKKAAKDTPSSNPTPKKRPIIGKATDTGITAVKKLRYANVFASRFDPGVEANALKTYLEGKLNFTIDTCEKLQSRYPQSYSSFNITSKCEDPSVFMSSDLWPEDSYVRWFRPKKATPGRLATIAKDNTTPHQVAADAGSNMARPQLVRRSTVCTGDTSTAVTDSTTVADNAAAEAASVKSTE